MRAAWAAQLAPDPANQQYHQHNQDQGSPHAGFKDVANNFAACQRYGDQGEKYKKEVAKRVHKNRITGSERRTFCKSSTFEKSYILELYKKGSGLIPDLFTAPETFNLTA